MPRQVVIVQNDPKDSETIRETFVRAGFDASFRVDAGGLAESLSTDVVLLVLDTTLPDLDAFQVCENLRDQRRFRNLPILLLSAGFDSLDILKGRAAGASDCLAKPVDPRELLEKIESLIEY